jgi:uncharacterized DUF497 family protein
VTRYEWDPQKAALNFRKHGVHFADAVETLEDERAVTIEDANADERRFKTLGLDVLGRLVVVAYTFRDETIRLISARKATRAELAIYQGKHR